MAHQSWLCGKSYPELQGSEGVGGGFGLLPWFRTVGVDPKPLNPEPLSP